MQPRKPFGSRGRTVGTRLLGLCDLQLERSLPERTAPTLLVGGSEFRLWTSFCPHPTIAGTLNRVTHLLSSMGI